MLKHVQVSPHRNRSDSVSLRSSISCSSSLCGSPEPGDNIQRTPSRASSYCSLNDALPQVRCKIKISFIFYFWFRFSADKYFRTFILNQCMDSDIHNDFIFILFGFNDVQI